MRCGAKTEDSYIAVKQRTLLLKNCSVQHAIVLGNSVVQESKY